MRSHSELSNDVEGFWNPVSIESIAPEAIEMFGLVWTGRRDEFCIERMSFCRELFQCFAHGHDVVKDQQVSYEMVVLDELALLIAYAFGGQCASRYNNLWVVQFLEEDLRTSFCGNLTYSTLDEIRELLRRFKVSVEEGEAFESGIRRWSIGACFVTLTPRQYAALKTKFPRKGA